MKLEGSCCCGAVRFAFESRTPYPFMRCYCSICRKSAGGGPFAVNIMGQAETLEIEGEDGIAVFRAEIEGKTSQGRRHFCGQCGSALWVADPRWPEWFYPFAAAIDSALPVPPERVHMMLDSAPAWAEVPEGGRDRTFPRYPEESIEAWHRRHGLYEEE